MSKIVLKSTKPNRRNITVQVVENVFVVFNDNQECEVEESDLEKILESNTDLSEVGKVIAKIEEKEVKQQKEEKEEGSELELLNVNELKDICKTANLEEKEYKNLSKKSLIEFIKKNLQK